MRTDLKPLFEYLDDFKLEVNERFDRVEGKVDVLQTSVDGLSKQVKDIGEEHIILRQRVEVLETN